MKTATFETSCTLMTKGELNEYREAKKFDTMKEYRHPKQPRLTSSSSLKKQKWNVVFHFNAENSDELVEKLVDALTRAPAVKIQDDIRRYTDVEDSDKEEEEVKNWRESIADDEGKLHMDADAVYDGIFIMSRQTKKRMTTEKRVDTDFHKLPDEAKEELIAKWQREIAENS